MTDTDPQQTGVAPLAVKALQPAAEAAAHSRRWASTLSSGPRTSPRAGISARWTTMV